MPQACLIYNPAAGRFPSRILTERAANVLRSRGWNVNLKETDGGQHITQLAAQAADQGLDVLLVAGGDGSLSRAISGLLGSKTALGVLPAGTANVWAQELGLPGLTWTRWMALEESAKLMANASVRKVDIGLCNKTPFLLWAGVGLDAFIVHRIEPRRRWEKHFAVAQYAASAVRHSSRWGGMNLRAIADQENITGRFLLAVASNIHLYAGGHAELSPSAKLDDARMDLWLFEGDSLPEVVKHAVDLWSGRHLDSEKARRFPFSTLKLESDVSLYVQLDGEPMKGNGYVNINVEPAALRVLIPQNAPRRLFTRSQL
jgi:YegS/Rv2252/BmrU family lipid kinase